MNPSVCYQHVATTQGKAQHVGRARNVSHLCIFKLLLIQSICCTRMCHRHYAVAPLPPFYVHSCHHQSTWGCCQLPSQTQPHGLHMQGCIDGCTHCGMTKSSSGMKWWGEKKNNATRLSHVLLAQVTSGCNARAWHHLHWCTRIGM
jgi:hypothetical protein